MKIPIIGTNQMLDVPDIIPKLAYKPIHAYSLKDLKLFENHRRLKVFFNKGVECSTPGCNNKGAFLLTYRDNNGAIHIDLYTEDFLLMTVDHTIPLNPQDKSIPKGSEKLSNKEPMCRTCNSKKGNK